MKDLIKITIEHQGTTYMISSNINNGKKFIFEKVKSLLKMIYKIKQ